mmetsp:Transcript_68287/g.149012  ORF Transcript_68287/g.149012 Transcript_68287/m.149012 type:complete len:108 (-) Transcript_68287:166-489(-)
MLRHIVRRYLGPQRAVRPADHVVFECADMPEVEDGGVPLVEVFYVESVAASPWIGDVEVVTISHYFHDASRAMIPSALKMTDIVRLLRTDPTCSILPFDPVLSVFTS